MTKKNNPIIPATRFADPTVDFAFKRIFGTETYKQATINLLNDIIPDIGIVSLEFINNELVGDTDESRKVVIDICCKDAAGNSFIIEMQKAPQEHFRERTLFYSSKFISLLGKQGRWDYSLPQVYVVSFLDFSMSKLGLNLPAGKYVLHYSLTDEETHEKMSGGTEYYFLGLRDFDKTEKKLANNREKWLFLLGNSSSLKEIPKPFVDDDTFAPYFEACERARFSKDEELKYTRDMMTKNDIENSKYEACVKAEAKGRAEGAAKAGREVAKKMKAKGFDAATIEECTGLSAEEIKSL